MPDPKPKMYVYPAEFQGRPALVLHTEDEWMHEDLWTDLIQRVLADTSNPGNEKLWSGTRRDGLQLADTSTDTSFRLALQHPKALAPAEAIARLIEFAPGFDWVVQDEADSREGPRFPSSGRISIEWREVAPGDEDVLTRYAFTVIATPDVDEEALAVVLDIASAHAFDLHLPIDPDTGGYRWLWGYRGRSYRVDFSPHSLHATHYDVVVWDLGPNTGESSDEPASGDSPVGATTWRAAPGAMNFPPDGEALDRIIGEVVDASN